MAPEVNPDLVKERAKCSFNIEEMSNFIDGGKEETANRRRIENIILSNTELFDKVPEEYLSHKEKYENGIRKSCLLANVIRDKLDNTYDEDRSKYIDPASLAVVKDMSPFLLHKLFLEAIKSQGTQEQQDFWLPRTLSLSIFGTYAQTEMGHGTFLRGLETKATYDAKTEEFVLHSPTLTSFKWWPGALGQTANHCVVLAQLYINDECHGLQFFIIKIRDEETHMPLPGIKLGDIGPKMGFNTTNNGFMGFDNFRIPRNAMLMKHAQVLKDGTYVKKATNDKLVYMAMVVVRVGLVRDCAHLLSKAVTIATRYSAVRHQCQAEANGPELPVLDYMTQQHKLFISISTTLAYKAVGGWIANTFKEVEKAINKGITEQLPELHALSCCLKAVCTTDAALGVEQCRLSCGGHGYILSSNLPTTYGIATAMRTYEGENTVLLLQTARFLVKVWNIVESNELSRLTPTVSYFADALTNASKKWENTPEGIIRGFKAVSAGKISTCVASMKNHVASGKSLEEAWALTTVQLVSAAEAHCRAVLLESSWLNNQRQAAQVSPNLRVVVDQLAELYLIYWTIEKAGDLFMYSSISGKDITILQTRYEELLRLIRPNAVGIVDAFDLRDEMLCSTLGSYDGRVYERLMDGAMKSPLNAEPVNQSFHQYLKPFMKGKL